MALKINLKLSKEGIDDALASVERGGRYDGPTPPPGVYTVKLRKLRHQRNKKDTHDMLVAWLTVDEDGDNAKYNGASVNEYMMIPNDVSETGANYRLNTIDEFFKAISYGKFGVHDFIEAASEGRMQAEDPDSRGASEITKIGRLTLAGDEKFKIKTKNETYNGQDQMRLHYIVSTPSATNDAADDIVEDDDLDLDDILEG